jgi:hypothetical protein
MYSQTVIDVTDVGANLNPGRAHRPMLKFTGFGVNIPPRASKVGHPLCLRRILGLA